MRGTVVVAKGERGLDADPGTKLSIAAALLSAGAAAIHASVAGPHFEERAVYGLLFVATALLPGGLGRARRWRRPRSRLFGVGVVLNAGGDRRVGTCRGP